MINITNSAKEEKLNGFKQELSRRTSSFRTLLAYADKAVTYAQSAVFYAHICGLYPHMRDCFSNAYMRPFKFADRTSEE